MGNGEGDCERRISIGYISATMWPECVHMESWLVKADQIVTCLCTNLGKIF